MTRSAQPTFSLLAPPYMELLALDDRETFPDDPRTVRGAALVWRLELGQSQAHLDQIARRPAGLPLMVVLPDSGKVSRMRSRVLEVLEEARPQSVLPFHPVSKAREFRSLLRAEPEDLAGEVLDYLWWRGLTLDQETRRILKRSVELSEELTTLSALARGVYLSRRALGRRFQRLGIPVPSHWLQFFRLLRATILLQNSRDSLCTIAGRLGYPDGFTLSSQMDRLVGVRPSLARERLGWEWFIESWLRREWEKGGLDVRLDGFPDRPEPHDPDDPPHAARATSPTDPVEGDTGSEDLEGMERAKRRGSAA